MILNGGVEIGSIRRSGGVTLVGGLHHRAGLVHFRTAHWHWLWSPTTHSGGCGIVSYCCRPQWIISDGSRLVTGQCGGWESTATEEEQQSNWNMGHTLTHRGDRLTYQLQCHGGGGGGEGCAINWKIQRIPPYPPPFTTRPNYLAAFQYATQRTQVWGRMFFPTPVHKERSAGWAERTSFGGHYSGFLSIHPFIHASHPRGESEFGRALIRRNVMCCNVCSWSWLNVVRLLVS